MMLMRSSTFCRNRRTRRVGRTFLLPLLFFFPSSLLFSRFLSFCFFVVFPTSPIAFSPVYISWIFWKNIREKSIKKNTLLLCCPSSCMSATISFFSFPPHFLSLLFLSRAVCLYRFRSVHLRVSRAVHQPIPLFCLHRRRGVPSLQK